MVQMGLRIMSNKCCDCLANVTNVLMNDANVLPTLPVPCHFLSNDANIWWRGCDWYKYGVNMTLGSLFFFNLKRETTRSVPVIASISPNMIFFFFFFFFYVLFLFFPPSRALEQHVQLHYKDIYSESRSPRAVTWVSRSECHGEMITFN